MGQTGVIYATKTKHSKKLAEAVAQALHAEAVNAAVSPEPRPADLLFIVGGIYGGKSLPELLQYVEKLQGGQVKKAVLVTSSVSTSLRRQADIRELLEGKGTEVLEELTCPGSFLFLKLGRPNAADIESVAGRAKQIAEQIG